MDVSKLLCLSSKYVDAFVIIVRTKVMAICKKILSFTDLGSAHLKLLFEWNR